MAKTTIIFVIFIFISITCPSCIQAQYYTNLTDYAALLAFKSGLIGSRITGSWNSTTHFCHWVGVSCSGLERVTALNLSGFSLQGTISPQLSNLSNLLVLDLSHNNLSGLLPAEFGRLSQLKSLNLTGNSLRGTIPLNISRCRKLEELHLSDNTITGAVPRELGLLTGLRTLRLNNNNLTGKVPSSLSNISKLEFFYLHENGFYGEIPPEFGFLSSLKLISFRRNGFSGPVDPSIFNISTLEIVDMSINRLSGELPMRLGLNLPNLGRLFLDSNRISGEIPAYLSNSSRLTYLYFTENDLQGTIPSELGRSLVNLIWFEFESNRISGSLPYTIFNISSLRILKARHNYLSGQLPIDLGLWLPDLEEIFLSHNQFTGGIPSTIANSTKLVYLEIANNSFTGQIPTLGNLVELRSLNLENNLLINDPNSAYLEFMSSLGNCRKLEYLIPSRNPLNGILPDSIGNLSSIIKVIDAESTSIKGRIPSGLGNLSSLIYLSLGNNDLEGKIPSSFAGLQRLERLYLDRNKLEGSIPAELCGLKMLGILYLGENLLSGSIPSFIENLTELREVSLAANRFNSMVPSSFWNLVNIQVLNLSRNLLNGSIVPEVGNLKALNGMDMSSNNFSGDIPNSIGNLQGLVILYLSKNSFQGPIPSTFGNLIVLEYLDLACNALSGTIPERLETLRDLVYLNLSFNKLQGEVPKKGVFADLDHQSLMENPLLCGGVPNLQLPVCPSPTSRKSKVSRILKITLPVLAGTLFLAIFSLVALITFCKRKNVRGSVGQDSSPKVGIQIITYHELVRATEHFSEDKLLGSGSSSNVYKGILSDGTVVAIKVFNMQHGEGGLENFDAECQVMCNIRHRNLVKVITTCSNLDFKAMVLEFMPNGSLDKWLYSESNYLSLFQRLDIALHVAMALEYLHHDCVEPVVHCDLKPSNVLLDENMVARVADFGIAKILAQDQQMARTRTLGTIGYIAPEYGLDGQVSTRGDVYSFGILLLEIFTKRKPTDEMFLADFTLPRWVMNFFPDSVMEVLDSKIVAEIDGKGDGIMERSLVSIIQVALMCVKESPDERISMREVVMQLKQIENGFNRLKVIDNEV